MGGQDGYTGLKEATGVQGGLETLIKRASTAFDQSVPVLSASSRSSILISVSCMTALGTRSSGYRLLQSLKQFTRQLV